MLGWQAHTGQAFGRAQVDTIKYCIYLLSSRPLKVIDHQHEGIGVLLEKEASRYAILRLHQWME